MAPMLDSSAAAYSEPLIIGSLLFNADQFVAELVRSRIRGMRDKEWGPYTAIGVIRRGVLLGGVVYHGYHGHDVQISCAFDKVGWALPGTVRALLAYPFDDLGVKRVTCIVGRKNKKSRKLLDDLGFTLEGVHKRGLDGFEDAFTYGLLKEDCRWIKDRTNGKKGIERTAAPA